MTAHESSRASGLDPAAGGGRRRIPPPFRPRIPETLRSVYEQYCAHEARELVALLPREGRRALLREELTRMSPGVEARGAPLAVDAIFRAARRVLPLPPYERWVPLYLANRRAYLERLGIPPVPARALPVTVATRPLGGGWWGHLDLRRVEDGWHGAIVFHQESGGTRGEDAPRTAEIFHGPDPEELRERFLAFAPAAMEGFLRSVLP